MKFFAVLACVLLGEAAVEAATVNIDFESFLDGTSLTNQLVDPTFTNAIVLSSGISLNEFEFPPLSGSNVLSDSGGPVRIQFATPVAAFSAYFTYLAPLSVQAFDSANNLVASTTSAFASNLALSGDAGSAPNEKLQLSYAAGITSVIITGDLNGGSFTMDDLSYPSGASEVPEPGTLFTALVGTLAVLRFRKR